METEDELEDEGEEVPTEGDGTEAIKTGEGEEEEEEAVEPLKASPDADTTFLFTKNSEQGKTCQEKGRTGGCRTTKSQSIS